MNEKGDGRLLYSHCPPVAQSESEGLDSEKLGSGTEKLQERKVRKQQSRTESRGTGLTVACENIEEPVNARTAASSEDQRIRLAASV